MLTHNLYKGSKPAQPDLLIMPSKSLYADAYNDLSWWLKGDSSKASRRIERAIKETITHSFLVIFKPVFETSFDLAFSNKEEARLRKEDVIEVRLVKISLVKKGFTEATIEPLIFFHLVEPKKDQEPAIKIECLLYKEKGGDLLDLLIEAAFCGFRFSACDYPVFDLSTGKFSPIRTLSEFTRNLHMICEKLTTEQVHNFLQERQGIIKEKDDHHRKIKEGLYLSELLNALSN